MALGELAADYPNTTTDDDGDLLGVSRPGESVTIEPAAQIELSAGPYDDLSAAYRTFEDFQKKVSGLLSPFGKHLVSYGYHPTAAARTLELIPKQRYEYMNSYLSRKDLYGPCMMRGSASTQVSIDYTSEDDCLRKMKIAYALVPLLSLMCDNSPIFEEPLEAANSSAPTSGAMLTTIAAASSPACSTRDFPCGITPHSCWTRRPSSCRTDRASGLTARRRSGRFTPTPP